MSSPDYSNVLIVYVRWQDAEAFGDAGWTDTPDLYKWMREEMRLCTSVGFLVYKDKEMIVLCDTLADSQVGQGQKIPIKWIKEISVMDFCEEASVPRAFDIEKFLIKENT